MPLPDRDIAWPPAELAQISPKIREWAAWWSGDAKDLATVYRNGTANLGPKDRPSQMRSGVVGAMARWWWGRPTNAATQLPDRTHVPLAADIARASADQLFAEPLNVTAKDQATMDRLGVVLGEQAASTFTAAGEQSAAVGGTYLQTVADDTVSEEAFLITRPADRAVPDFLYGRVLRAVTFWEVLADDGREVWRHLERHELREKIGVIEHGLYKGTPTDLGQRRPLEEHPGTEAYAALVDEESLVVAGRTPGLAVTYIPNTEPDLGKAWRDVPGARGWGAADIDGIEGMLDNLDEQYASWMRDLRLGKARILLAKYMLDDLGPGLGAGFDMDREIFSPLKMAAAEDGDAPITPHQFKIRFQEHQATVDHWTDQIIGSAGYAAQTFGREGDGAAQTATEVDAKESRTVLTRGRKIRLWTPALQSALTKLVTVDADVFGKDLNPEGIKVEFPDAIHESPEVVARTANELRAARAASTETLVRMVNPDWDDPMVKAEVAKIEAEGPAPLPDPFAIQA